MPGLLYPGCCQSQVKATQPLVVQALPLFVTLMLFDLSTPTTRKKDNEITIAVLSQCFTRILAIAQSFLEKAETLEMISETMAFRISSVKLPDWMSVIRVSCKVRFLPPI